MSVQRSFHLASILGLLVALCLLQTVRLEAAQAYAQLSSLKNQVPTKSIGQNVVMESVDEILNIDVDPKKEKVIVKEDGVYFIMSVAQVGATVSPAAGYVDVWLTKNGVGVPNSGSRMSVASADWTGTLISQTVMALKAGDAIGSQVAASRPGLGFIYISPKGEPANSSISFSIFKLE